MRDWCAICNARIKPQPVDGSDPKKASSGWWEIYECERGHTGRLEYSPEDGERTTGALEAEPQVIA